MTQNSRFLVCVIARVSIEIYWFRDKHQRWMAGSFVGKYFTDNKLIRYSNWKLVSVIIFWINSTSNCFRVDNSSMPQWNFTINLSVSNQKTSICFHWVFLLRLCSCRENIKALAWQHAHNSRTQIKYRKWFSVFYQKYFRC